MAAATAGVPAVAVGHDPRLLALARRLGHRSIGPGAAPAELASAVVSALDAPPPDPVLVDEEMERAEEAFRLLRLLLSRGRAEDPASLSGLPLAPFPWAP